MKLQREYNNSKYFSRNPTAPSWGYLEVLRASDLNVLSFYYRCLSLKGFWSFSPPPFLLTLAYPSDPAKCFPSGQGAMFPMALWSQPLHSWCCKDSSPAQDFGSLRTGREPCWFLISCWSSSTRPRPE